ncbi:MAG: hypothetical protein PHE27_01515 [Alphaproteobacteria bacterium]|nr:hypothetical protein [Alphaproteobacteria bacterium]
MSLSQKEITALGGNTRILVIDRASLPHETVFKNFFANRLARLTDSQTNDRINFILSHPRLPRGWKHPSDGQRETLATSVSMACGWGAHAGRTREWSEKTVALGNQIFGNWFNSYPKGHMRISASILATDSPYIGDTPAANPIVGILNKQISPDLDLRHEIGHTRFAYSAKEEENDANVLYFGEALADGFMAHTHLYGVPETGDGVADRLKALLPGKNKQTRSDAPPAARAEEIQMWIHQRRLEAFFNTAASYDWTAAAIEATLQKQRIPNWDETFYLVRGLQIRTFDTILAEENGEKNLKEYSRYERENTFYYEGPLDKNALHDPLRTVVGNPEKYPAEKLIETLVGILDTHELPEATRREGEKIVEAYNAFCPENTVPFSPKLHAAPIPALTPAPR